MGPNTIEVIRAHLLSIKNFPNARFDSATDANCWATADQRPLRTAIHADLRQPAVRRMEQGLSSAEQGRMTQSSNGSGA